MVLVKLGQCNKSNNYVIIKMNMVEILKSIMSFCKWVLHFEPLLPQLSLL